MKKTLFLGIGLLCNCLLIAQNIPILNGISDPKNRFDLSEQVHLSKSKSAVGSTNTTWLANQSDVYQYTLMNGGYFTIGTNKGISDSIFDDQCQLTFGHPFALSSNPLITVDGHKYNPIEYLDNPDVKLSRVGDSLRYSVTLLNGIKTIFSIHLKSTGNIEMSYTVTNNSTSSHKVKLGLLFDAALGKWGDGNLFYNQSFVQNPTVITDKPDKLDIWERATGQKGIGMSLDYFANKPSRINAGNWQDLYNNVSSVNSIFDLALLHEWDEVQLQPAESSSFKVQLALLKPDIQSNVFLRWDMPSSLTIANNMLFPLKLNSLVKIVNNDKNSNTGLSFKIPASEYITEWTSASKFTLTPKDTLNLLSVPVQISEVFDSILMPVTLQLLSGQTVVDQITRNLMVPAAPFSNTGLTVSIDTVSKNNGFIHLNFSVQKDENHQILTSLTKNNILFYKDDLPITDFTMGKDTTGGVNKADIIFVLDVTGSMTEEINGVKNNIIEFTDSLSARGVDFKLGLVTFLDVIENTYAFTSNVQTFYNQVSIQRAHGGDDYPENSLQALLTASQFPFRPDAKRMIIWITDAAFHINNAVTQLTKEQVVNELLLKSVQVHCIGNAAEQLNFYDQIIINTGGDFFNINGNFRDVLLKVSKIGESPRYVINYLPSPSITTSTTFKVEAHSAGLGGSSTIIYNPALQKAGDGKATINMYPNPIKSNSNLTITGCNSNKCKIELYNTLGQVVYKNTIQSENNSIELNNVIPKNQAIGNRLLFMRISIINNDGDIIDNQTINFINN